MQKVNDQVNEEQNSAVPSGQPLKDNSLKDAPTPRAGDVWEFKLPGKRKRTKEVGKVDKHPPYQRDVDRPYVHWQRENKGRYTGISVERLMQFGHRVSTKAERDARTKIMMEQARVKREQRRQVTSDESGTTTER